MLPQRAIFEKASAGDLAKMSEPVQVYTACQFVKGQNMALNYFQLGQEELQADDIISCVCNFYKVSKADLLSKKKTKEIVLARQVGMYLVLEMMSLPQLTVGKIFGRDHATVIYARDKITEQMEIDRKLSVEVNDIKKMLLKQ